MNSQTIDTAEISSQKPKEVRCPSCDSKSFENDSATGEKFCRECGTVIEEDKIDTTGPRTFSTEQKQNKERSGSKITFTRHDKGISTQIGSGSMRNVSANKRGQYYRLRKWHSRSSGSKSRNLKTAFNKISDLINQLNLTNSVEEEAARLYEKSVDEGVVKGRKIEKIAAASVFIVARNQRVPRTLKEFSKATEIDQREIGKNYRYLAKELDIDVEPVRAEDFVSRYSSKIGVSGQAQADARKVILKAREEGLTSGRSPDGIAAAAIYKSAKQNGEKITQREVSDVAGVTEVTIRKGSKQLDEIGF